MISFFDDEDISFLKGLLKKILKSKLFKEVYLNYSNVGNTIDYYFDEDENIDDLLNRIKILPYKERNTDRQAETVKKN